MNTNQRAKARGFLCILPHGGIASPLCTKKQACGSAPSSVYPDEEARAEMRMREQGQRILPSAALGVMVDDILTCLPGPLVFLWGLFDLPLVGNNGDQTSDSNLWPFPTFTEVLVPITVTTHTAATARTVPASLSPRILSILGLFSTVWEWLFI